MSHFFRNICFALVTLSISYNSCVAMEENDTLLRRNITSATDLNKSDSSRIIATNEKERIQTVAEYGCVHIILDYIFYKLGYDTYKCENNI
jgi:hypothetical protein